MMAADMSRRLGWIDAALLQRIRALNEAAKLPVAPPPVRCAGSRAARGGAAAAGACVPATRPHACTPSDPSPAQQNMTVQQFRDTMAVDKKVQDGKLRLILLKCAALGRCAGARHRGAQEGRLPHAAVNARACLRRVVSQSVSTHRPPSTSPRSPVSPAGAR